MHRNIQSIYINKNTETVKRVKRTDKVYTSRRRVSALKSWKRFISAEKLKVEMRRYFQGCQSVLTD